MSQAGPLRVLAVGDPFLPASMFTRAFGGLGDAVAVTELQIERADAPPPRTASERILREYAGDPADVAAAVAGHDVLVVHGAPVTAEVLAAAPLRLVCCARGGPVNVDVAAATRCGVPVAITPGKNAEAVAELTLLFALMLIRGVPASARYLRDGGRHGDSTFEGASFIGGEAASMTLGLVGLGHVGRNVAIRARSLGFRLLAHDPALPGSVLPGNIPPGNVPAGVRLVPFDDLLAQSQIVSVHARATAGNRHLLGAAAFARMPRGSFLINTARASLVDEDALQRALVTGALAGAALDVAERSSSGNRHPLLDLPNVIITPHIGGATRETLRRGAEMAVAAVTRLISGELPDHLQNPGFGSGPTAAS